MPFLEITGFPNKASKLGYHFWKAGKLFVHVCDNFLFWKECQIAIAFSGFGRDMAVHCGRQ
jgi:hypothetical protein